MSMSLRSNASRISSNSMALAQAYKLAHAGRKASTNAPWRGGATVKLENGGWEPVAPIAVPFGPASPLPRALTLAEIHRIVDEFGKAAQRALEACFQVIEIHGAHGYPIHEFLSPLSNKRKYEYGGSLENRMRFALEVVRRVRKEWPATLPLFFRISATDWSDEGGWTVDDSVALAQRLKPLEVDVIDCSSGGNLASARIPLRPGYQVPFAERIRRETGLLTGAVGLITKPEKAESIVASGSADLVLLAREFLRDSYCPIKAARQLGVDIPIAAQYERAFPPRTKTRAS